LVVPVALVFVVNEKGDGGAGRLSLENARQDFHPIRLAALGDMPRGAGPAPVQVTLDVLFGQLHPGRAPVDHATDSGTVTLTERRHAEQLSEGIAGHARSQKSWRKFNIPLPPLTGTHCGTSTRARQDQGAE